MHFKAKILYSDKVIKIQDGKLTINKQFLEGHFCQLVKQFQGDFIILIA